jgi:hypothetical protein
MTCKMLPPGVALRAESSARRLGESRTLGGGWVKAPPPPLLLPLPVLPLEVLPSGLQGGMGAARASSRPPLLEEEEEGRRATVMESPPCCCAPPPLLAAAAAAAAAAAQGSCASCSICAGVAEEKVRGVEFPGATPLSPATARRPRDSVTAESSAEALPAAGMRAPGEAVLVVPLELLLLLLLP